MDFFLYFINFLCACELIAVAGRHLDNNVIDEHLESIVHSRKLRSAGFEHFQISTLYEVDDNDVKTDFDSDHFKRRKRSTEDSVKFHFSAYGEDYFLVVQHKSSVVHPEAKIIITHGNNQEQWTGPHPDCFLTGEVPSHEGTVSMSYCDEVIGGIRTKDHTLHVEELPHHLKKRNFHLGKAQLLVARKLNEDNWKKLKSDNKNMPLNVKSAISTASFEHASRKKRAVQAGDITVELAVYTDEAFTALFPYTDVTKRIEAMAVKYNGVEMEWGRFDQLYYNISYTIKYMNFFETNPSYYNTSTSTLSVMLSSFCSGKQGGDEYDHFYIHVGKQGLDVTGRAYLGKMCDQSANCACDNVKSITEYVATAHEIGHNFGMNHDIDENCLAPNVGVMGSYGAGWSTCSFNSLDNFLKNNDVTCLWTENVATTPSNLQSLTLVPQLVGQTKSPDQVCEIKYGTGFKFRRYPLLDICLRHACADHNPGSTYGQIFMEAYNIPGQYCDVGKICFKFNCETWETAKQENLTIQTGGWGNWGAWTECDRTCGRGVRFRRRMCDSPIAINQPGCDGDEYDASACNKTACPDDSSDVSALKTQRASESCAILVDNGIISGGEFAKTGTRYSYQDDGQCEVKCDTLSNYTETNAYRRYGFMPHGTPCDGTLSSFDSNDWPRKSGSYYMCVDGLCRKFGCDDQFNGMQYDECGVCGGDNSTCDVVSGQDTVLQSQGDRRTVAVLPVGAFNIQFWFTYSAMKQNYLEIFTKENGIVLSSVTPSNWIYTTGENPISFAGVYWHFAFNTQHLYASGSITEPAFIKVYQNRAFANVGINYIYSVPKSVATCSGSCQNGGTYNASMCACECPSGYIGNGCGTASNCPATTFCQNGGVLDHSTCQCDCGDRAYGSTCKLCNYPFTGPGCQTCKVTTCESCSTFNETTCQCECLQGYGGLQCDSVCADTSSTCAADAAAGKCQSDNINMWPVCMDTCGFCNSTTPMATCGGTTLSLPTTTQPSQGSTTVTYNCPIMTFSCGTGLCVDYIKMCDGVDDCGNNNDEDTSNVLCGSFGNVPLHSFTTLLLSVLLSILFSVIFTS